MKSKYDIILFDLDGTTADTDEVVVDAFVELFNKYNKEGMPSRREMYYFSGPSLKETISHYFKNQDVDFLINEYYRISGKLYDGNTKTMPHEVETIRNFKKCGIKMGVVTNKDTTMAHEVLRIIGLHDYFDVIIGSTDVIKTKPHEEGILKAESLLKAKDLKRVLYVGDNGIDYQTAQNAGIDCAIYLCDKREFPKDLHPKFKFKNYLELEREVLYE